MFALPPQASPGTPAWLGTPTTVSRALRLIAESGLDDGGVGDWQIAWESEHATFGAFSFSTWERRRARWRKPAACSSPRVDRRNQSPMGEVALSSGFGCVRRFNAAIRKVYKRTPTQIRRLLATQACSLTISTCSVSNIAAV